MSALLLLHLRVVEGSLSRGVSDARDWKAARALYIDESQKVVDEEGKVEYGGVDRMIKRSDALASGQAGDEMDNVD